MTNQEFEMLHLEELNRLKHYLTKLNSKIQVGFNKNKAKYYFYLRTEKTPLMSYQESVAFCLGLKYGILENG